MRGTLTLPDGYAGLCSIDLQKDKRLALLINGLALLIALPLVFLGNRIVLLRTLFSMDDGFWLLFSAPGYADGRVCGICCPARTGAWRLYEIFQRRARALRLHRAVRVCGQRSLFYKEALFYHRARAGGRLGRGAAGLCMLAARAVVLTVYLIQIGNIAGAAGDFYVVWRFAAMPPDILVRDAGVDMTVYSRGRKVQAQ